MDNEEKLIGMLDGDLSPNEIYELEQAIEKDPELKKDKELYNKIIMAINLHGKKSLSTELDQYLHEHLDQKPKGGKVISMRNMFFYSGIAAAIVIGTFYFSVFDNQQSPIQLNSDQTPIHADSAVYENDTIRIEKDSIK